jgi:hypothetical protein
MVESKMRVADFAIMASLLLGRLGFLLLTPTGLSGDGFGYVNAAQTVVDSGKLPALFIQPRGYSLLITPLLASGLEIDRAVLIMNALLDFSIVALLLWTAKNILPRPEDRGPRILCWLVKTLRMEKSGAWRIPKHRFASLDIKRMYAHIIGAIPNSTLRRPKLRQTFVRVVNDRGLAALIKLQAAPE